MKKLFFILFALTMCIKANAYTTECNDSISNFVFHFSVINSGGHIGSGPHTPIQVNASAYLSNGYIYVDATCYSGMTLDVYVEDEDGITYSYSTHDASSTFAVDVTSLSSGTYYLRITSDDLSYDLIGEFEIE